MREDGTVKVLDFGLAKALDPEPGSGAANSPTISLTAAATQMGMVIGTAAYMSPEQAKGKVADKRADIWAFGVVLLEMLTGHRVFSGETVSETLAAVMMKEPEWDRLPADLPSTLADLLRRCVQKDPRQRVRDIGDVRLAMEGTFQTAASTPSEPTAIPTLPVWLRPIPLALAGVALLGLGLAVGTVMRPVQPSPESLARFVINTPPDGPLFRSEGHPEVAISPDGIVKLSCGWQSRPMTSQAPSYRGYRFPPDIISHAVWLYHRFGLSFRDVEDLLAERGITVTYEAIRHWCRTFGLDYARRLRHRRGRQGDTWHLDELFVKIRGRQQYLWLAVDEDGDVLDILVQSRRNRQAAKRFFRKLLKRQGCEPRRLITDKLRSYSAGHRTVMPSVVHSTWQRKQPSGGLASTDSSARAADARVQVGRPSATVRIGARRCPESVQGRPPPAPGSSPPSLESPLVPSLG